MRKLIFSFAALAALVSCAKENPAVDTPAETFEEITIHAVSAETKTQLGNDGRNVQWSAGDVIKVCMPAEQGWDSSKRYYGVTATFAAQGEDVDESVLFKGDWNTSASCGSDGFVCYPQSVEYSSSFDPSKDHYVNEAISYDLKTVQEAIEGTFDKDLNLAVAPIKKSDLNKNNPEVTFKNSCALFEITLPETDYNIKSIKIEMDNNTSGRSMTGNINLTYSNGNFDCSAAKSGNQAEEYVILEKADGGELVPGKKYYAVVWPVMYGTLKFTFTDAEGNTAEKTVSGKYYGAFDCQAGKCEKFNFVSALNFSKEPVLEVDQTSFSFDTVGGTASFNVSANNNWTVTSNQSWLTVSPASGNPGVGQTVTISAAENTTDNERTATITVTAGGITKTITVSQDGPQISVKWEYGSVGSGETMDYISVASNVAWTLSADQTWVTIAKTSGGATAGEKVKVTFPENPDSDARTVTFTIKNASGSVVKTLTATQPGNPNAVSYKRGNPVHSNQLVEDKMYIICLQENQNMVWTNSNNKLVLSELNNSTIRKENVMIFDMTAAKDSGLESSKGYNASCVGKFKSAVNNRNLDSTFNFSSSTSTDWSFANKWGNDTGYDIDIYKNGSYSIMIYSTKSFEIKQAEEQTAGANGNTWRKWYIYEVEEVK